MINLFRKIRKQLVGSNDFINYSKYAIGEIILIVIGILLALYLNNLNNDRAVIADQVKHFIKYYPEGNAWSDFEFARPFDYEYLLEDNYFKSINAEIISNRRWNINSLQNMILKIQKLIVAIEAELEVLTS